MLEDTRARADDTAFEGEVRIVVRSADSGVVLDLGPERIAAGSLNKRLLLLELVSATLDVDTGAGAILGRAVGLGRGASLLETRISFS